MAKTDGLVLNVSTLVSCSWDSRVESGPQDGLSWGRLRCVSSFPANSYSNITLTIILLTWRIRWAPNNASRWDLIRRLMGSPCIVTSSCTNHRTERWTTLNFTHRVCACILPMIRSDCFSIQYPLLGHFNMDTLFLWGRNWVSKCNANQIVCRASKWEMVEFFCSYSSSSFRTRYSGKRSSNTTIFMDIRFNNWMKTTRFGTGPSSGFLQHLELNTVYIRISITRVCLRRMRDLYIFAAGKVGGKLVIF
jgi:hypothetical protein